MQKKNFILDNLDGNTVSAAFKTLFQKAESLDIATGYFELSALLELSGSWEHLKEIRILMGDETSQQTREMLLKLVEKNDLAIEKLKGKSADLSGLQQIELALREGRIKPRIAEKGKKFHAKLYLPKFAEPEMNSAYVGSSNFTKSGLTQNIELNIKVRDAQYEELNAWFETLYQRGQDISDEVLKALTRHTRDYTPFEIYVKALLELVGNREMSLSQWEKEQSVIYPILDEVQREGYKRAVQIAEGSSANKGWKGALICDGVGFGKTFIGLMLLERYLFQGKNVLLLVPSSARNSVWETNLERFNLKKRYKGRYVLLNHTDLIRKSENIQQLIDLMKSSAHVVIVDEAHHFRNLNLKEGGKKSRSQVLYELTEKKLVYLLTATPLNNSVHDVRRLIEYFSRRERQDYFAPIGIHNLNAEFRRLEKAIEEKMIAKRLRLTGALETTRELDTRLAEDTLHESPIFHSLIVQRSRAYARERLGIDNFPKREKPTVKSYSLEKVYGDVFPQVLDFFDKKRLKLSFAVYNPEQYKILKQSIDAERDNLQKQLAGLSRISLLKRMESSYVAFLNSLEALLRKNIEFLRLNSPDRFEQWRSSNLFWSNIEERWKTKTREQLEEEQGEEPDEDEVDALFLGELDAEEKLNPNEFDIPSMTQAVLADIDALTQFLASAYERLSNATDDKFVELATLLKSKALKGKKILIFTQYRDTARYLFKRLKGEGFKNIEQLDSTSQKDRESIIKRFSPVYNCTLNELETYSKNQIDVLVSTDVLSEGLNLQDASVLINYDLHWNPVRLIQRIGRIDRRLSIEKERHLNRYDQASNTHAATIFIYNFLPPNELNRVLGLYENLSGKVLKISATLGIEGGYLVDETEVDTLRTFNSLYESQESVMETMQLAFVKLCEAFPDVVESARHFPNRVWSGKHSEKGKGVFFCYRFPNGVVKWYLHLIDGEILEDKLDACFQRIQTTPDEPRCISLTPDAFHRLTLEVEERCVQRYMRDLQLHTDQKPTLVCALLLHE
ncbi:MAG: helicase-related protein [Chloroherpetonaceae bacterium]